MRPSSPLVPRVALGAWDSQGGNKDSNHSRLKKSRSSRYTLNVSSPKGSGTHTSGQFSRVEIKGHWLWTVARSSSVQACSLSSFSECLDAQLRQRRESDRHLTRRRPAWGLSCPFMMLPNPLFRSVPTWIGSFESQCAYGHFAPPARAKMWSGWETRSSFTTTAMVAVVGHYRGDPPMLSFAAHWRLVPD